MRLDENLTARVLQALGVTRSQPDVALLDALVAGYVRRVPWESAFRIAKRARTAETADCPRWPDEFWADALERGGGGTCCESNYAIAALLRALGLEVDLTINDMQGHVGCHTALIARVGGERWLVDVGYPLHLPLRLADIPTERETRIHTYQAELDGAGKYTITRDRHPGPYVFTLIDQPVDEATYRAALQADYGPDGLFLDKVVIVKIVNEQLWRFNSAEPPAHLQHFTDGQRENMLIQGATSERLSAHFGLAPTVVQAAFDALKQNEVAAEPGD